jgi:hypothetical protein
MTRRRSAAPSARFTLWWYRLMLVGAFGFFAVLLLSLLLTADNVVAMLYTGAGLIAMLVVVARVSRSASVELGEDEIVIRGLRIRRFAWERVRDVGATRGSSAALLPWRVPYFELDDGSIVRAEEIRSLREGTIVDEVVAEARNHLR